jgi:hypothetical protein
VTDAALQKQEEVQSRPNYMHDIEKLEQYEKQKIAELEKQTGSELTEE